MTLTTRPADITDLDAIIELTRRRRRILATWEPGYWHPRDGADTLHARFLGLCIEASHVAVHVAVDAHRVVGCAIAQPQLEHCFLDDLSVANERWHDIGTALVTSMRPRTMVTCCPHADIAETSWLHASGAREVSHYHRLDLRAPSTTTPTTTTPTTTTPPTPPSASVTTTASNNTEPAPARPVHTFANGRIHPDTPGALVIHTNTGNVIASPSVTPPIYDPGGPTTIVEQITGTDRTALLRATIHAATQRGDTQLIVVCAHDDAELHDLLERAGFRVPVDVWHL